MPTRSTIHGFTVLASKSFSFEPMLCEGVERPSEGVDCRYELKLDGFRAIGRRSGRSAQLWSPNQKDFTRRFTRVSKAISNLPNDTVIDGEIVALDGAGRPLFNLLQGFGNARAIVLYAFGLLMVRGKDVRAVAAERPPRIFERSSPHYPTQSAIGNIE
jgi:bifunctional non-homologous end joining protein LigD